MLDVRPQDLVGHWWMTATTTSMFGAGSPITSAQILVAPPSERGQIAQVEFATRARAFRFRGALVRDGDASGYSWRGPLGMTLVARRSWRLARTADGDVLSTSHSGSVLLNAGSVLFTRVGATQDRILERVELGADDLGLAEHDVAQLAWRTPPPVEVTAEARRRFDDSLARRRERSPSS